jgi:flagellar basal body-associated protein FliL
MAEKEKTEAKPTPAPEAAGDAKPKKKGKLVPLLVIGGLMIVQGVGVYFVTKMMTGAPAAAEGAEHAEGEATEGDHGASDDHGSDSHAAPADEHGKASDGHGGKSAAPVSKGPVEIDITECRPNNRTSGKLISLKLRVSALVMGSEAEKAKTLVEGNKARINDRVNVVVRSATPQELNEPGLETIKRRLKQELARVLCDEKLILEVLIPELMQSGSGL